MILDGENSPEWFVDSTDLTPTDHLETQSIIQKYTDGAISKTINVPNNTTPNELSRLLLEYMRDLKGVTVYRDGSKEGQILIPISRKEALQALQDENADHNPDIETVQCSTGSCDV
jgi:ribonucleoside-diphosphate reductase alpha chain